MRLHGKLVGCESRIEQPNFVWSRRGYHARIVALSHRLRRNVAGQTTMSNDITHSTPNPLPPPSGFDAFLVWKEYQTIAMHFNDLLTSQGLCP
jgi:hypothetical protein